jgi:hypothetical protein
MWETGTPTTRCVQSLQHGYVMCLQRYVSLFPGSSETNEPGPQSWTPIYPGELPVVEWGEASGAISCCSVRLSSPRGFVEVVSMVALGRPHVQLETDGRPQVSLALCCIPAIVRNLISYEIVSRILLHGNVVFAAGYCTACPAWVKWI